MNGPSFGPLPKLPESPLDPLEDCPMTLEEWDADARYDADKEDAA